MNSSEFLLQFDGASKGNPGPSGCGATIIYQNKEIAFCYEKLGIQTNNYAEYSGLLIGLRKANELGITHIIVQGDSKLIINQLNGSFTVKSQNLANLYNDCMALSQSFENITFQHIYRNANSRADELANLGCNI